MSAQDGAVGTVLPARLAKLESPQPISVIDDDPVFDSNDAAKILGVSVECLKKWRQRNFGPEYIQYGKNGPIRYALSALLRFRSQNTCKRERLS